jgi:hypothetical protein
MLKKVTGAIGGLMLMLTPFVDGELRAGEHNYIPRSAPESRARFSPQVQHSIPLTGISINTQRVTQSYPVVTPHHSIQRVDTGCGTVCLPQTTYEIECRQRSWNRVSGVDYNFCDSIGAEVLRGAGGVLGGTLNVAGEGLHALGNGLGKIGSCIDNRSRVCEPRGYFHPPVQTPICQPINPCLQPKCEPCESYSSPRIIYEQTITPRPQNSCCEPTISQGGWKAVDPVPDSRTNQGYSLPNSQTPTLAPRIEAIPLTPVN